jgi:hypothetical protein
MHIRRFNFETVTLVLAIPIILLVGAASVFLLLGAVKQDALFAKIGQYASVPIYIWTAIPLLALLYAVLVAGFQNAVRLFKPYAFPREIAVPLEFAPKPALVRTNGGPCWSDDQIMKWLATRPNLQPATHVQDSRVVDYTASAHSLPTGDIAAKSIVPPASGVKVFEMTLNVALSENSLLEQEFVENFKNPEGTKKLVLVWREINDQMVGPVCDFLQRLINGALDMGAELAENFRVFSARRDQLIQELFNRLAMDDHAMHRLGANNAYQLLPIVMRIFQPIPMAA